MNAKRSVTLLTVLAALAVAPAEARCQSQTPDDASESYELRRVVRVDSEDAGTRKVVRVFATPDNKEAKPDAHVVFVGEEGPEGFEYSYGFPRSGGFLGVQLIEMTPELRRHFGAPANNGVLVSRITEDSPASKAGLEVGDVLSAIDGEPVATAFDVARRISALENGTVVSLEIWRGGKVQTVSATVVERERTAVDLGQFMLPHGGKLERRLKIDLDNLPEQVIEIDEEGIQKALRDFQLHLEDGKMSERFRALGQDRIELQNRIEELEERLKQLERQLDKLPKD